MTSPTTRPDWSPRPVLHVLHPNVLVYVSMVRMSATADRKIGFCFGSVFQIFPAFFPEGRKKPLTVASRARDTHNRGRMELLRRLVVLDVAKLGDELVRVIVPMDGHGEGVTDQDAVEGAADAIDRRGIYRGRSCHRGRGCDNDGGKGAGTGGERGAREVEGLRSSRGM